MCALPPILHQLWFWGVFYWFGTCECVSVCWVWHHSLRHNYIIRHPPPPSPAPPGPSQLPEQVSRPKCCADLNSPRETPLKAAGTQTHSETGSQRPRLPPSQMCLRMKYFWGQETPKHLSEEPINQRRSLFSDSSETWNTLKPTFVCQSAFLTSSDVWNSHEI